MGIAIFALFTYGSLNYSWLEDNDPYDHASAVRFISEFWHPIQPEPYKIHYLTPYPPLYDMLATIFYKLTPFSIPVALKIFNSLLCGLAIPAFYLWAKTKYGDNIGIWASFIIFSLPSFMSHFIWAQSLAILLMFPAMYLFEKRDKYFIPAMALVLISQPSVAVIFTIIMSIYALAERRDYHLIAFGIAVAFAVFWLPVFLYYSIDTVMKQITFTDIYTYPSQFYGLSDFIDAPFGTKIDQATGLGAIIFISALAGLGIFIRERNLFLPALFAFCLIGTESSILPIKLFPHRFWVFLAIPVAVLSAKAICYIIDYVKSQAKSETMKTRVCQFISIVIIIMIYFTSITPKIVVQTSQWSPSEFLTAEHAQGWIGLSSKLPKDTMVFAYCMKEQIADGMQLHGLAWDKEVINHKSLDFTAEQDYQFLKSKGYEYAVIDISCMQSNNPEKINGKLNGNIQSGYFRLREDLSNIHVLVLELVRN